MTVKIKEKNLLYTTPKERKPMVLDKITQILEEIENEDKEISGYLFFAFYPSGGSIETLVEYEGLVNPVHVAEALASYGILCKIERVG